MTSPRISSGNCVSVLARILQVLRVYSLSQHSWCPYSMIIRLPLSPAVHSMSRAHTKSTISTKYVSLFEGKMLCPNLTFGGMYFICMTFSTYFFKGITLWPACERVYFHRTARSYATDFLYKYFECTTIKHWQEDCNGQRRVGQMWITRTLSLTL